MVIAVLLECELTKQTLKLNQEKWNYLMSKTNFKVILNKLYIYSNQKILTGNIFYSINANNQGTDFITNASFDRSMIQR